MFSKTRQNLLNVVEFPLAMLNCLDWKYKTSLLVPLHSLHYKLSFHYIITLQIIFSLHTLNDALDKNRYLHNIS